MKKEPIDFLEQDYYEDYYKYYFDYYKYYNQLLDNLPIQFIVDIKDKDYDDVWLKKVILCA